MARSGREYCLNPEGSEPLHEGTGKYDVKIAPIPLTHIKDQQKKKSWGT